VHGNILIVDDDAETAETLALSLALFGFHATAETDPAVALRLAEDDALDAVLTDLRMSPIDGIALCTQLAASRPDLPVVVMTGQASIPIAVDAMRAGAFDFVVKPIVPDVVALTLERAVAHHQLKREVHLLRSVVAARSGSSSLLGESAAMQKVFDVVERIAPTSATVLITGESGTGKELIARAIHDKSARRSGPFIAINCAAVPATLLESELFGHVKGAFTDARASRRGLFLEAHGGTLFLDEIGEMPLEMQVKLLRALQERRVRPVGGTAEIPFDARILAATNRDLARDVEAKRFREDLYYRVNVCSVSLPPLREREGDVLVLAEAFLARFAAKYDKHVVGITALALAELVRYPWPGNVRELENGIESAVAMAQHDRLELGDLPERVRSAPSRAEPTTRGPLVADSAPNPPPPASLVSLREHERLYLRHVLSVLKGNKSAAAAVLGFDRRTLHRKLKAMRDALGTEPDATDEPSSGVHEGMEMTSAG
jgi:two-component system response regulator HydG